VAGEHLDVTTLAPQQVQLPPLHDGQIRIASSPARFKVVANGRRWGKTMLGVWLCAKTGIEGGRTWWVAPTYKIAREGWRVLSGLAAQIPGAEVRRGELEVRWLSGGVTQVRSADDPQSLRGAGLDGVVMDEAAYIQEEAWGESIRPALADRRGWALFISTPRGKNWFYHLWSKAFELDGWQAWHAPTVDNPFIHKDEIEAARLSMGPLAFAQEFEASFDVMSNAVYPHFDRSIHVRQLEEGTRFVDGAFGADFGRVHKSAAVAISRDQAGRLWVRAAWGRPSEDHGVALRRTVADLRAQYSLRRGRVDPNQDVLAGLLQANIAKSGEGSRQHRIDLTARLLNTFPGGIVPDLKGETRGRAMSYGPNAADDTPGLLFVKGAPGIDELCDELEAYHYEHRLTDTKDEMVVARINDDLVAAMEYAIEELEEYQQPDYSRPLQVAGANWGPVRTAR
jgi:hypothetical protein